MTLGRFEYGACEWPTMDPMQAVEREKGGRGMGIYVINKFTTWALHLQLVGGGVGTGKLQGTCGLQLVRGGQIQLPVNRLFSKKIQTLNESQQNGRKTKTKRKRLKQNRKRIKNGAKT